MRPTHLASYLLYKAEINDHGFHCLTIIQTRRGLDSELLRDPDTGVSDWHVALYRVPVLQTQSCFKRRS